MLKDDDIEIFATFGLIAAAGYGIYRVLKSIDANKKEKEKQIKNRATNYIGSNKIITKKFTYSNETVQDNEVELEHYGVCTGCDNFRSLHHNNQCEDCYFND